MVGQIIEISQDGRSVHKERGFLAIRDDGQTIGRVPLDDIDAVIVAAHGLQWSNNALVALVERGAPIVLMGHNYAPAGYILSVNGHHDQGLRFEAQAAAGKPLRKRLWAQIIRAKITAQAEMLALIGKPHERLIRLVDEVQSGDPTNREAVAAQFYWPQLMGADFRRDQAASGVNAMLNYGYAVLRAATARAIVAGGLHPSLGLHHKSGGDGLRLADDLMEPFRPTIDLVVYDLLKSGEREVTTDIKRSLAAALEVDFQTVNGRTPLSHVLVRQAQSLATVFQKEAKAISLPKPLLPCARELSFISLD